MTEFSFAFSYDRSRRVAWLALDGYLDEPAARRLRRVLRATIGGLAPRELLVDARELTHLNGASIYRLLRAGATAERPECDVRLVTRGVVRELPRTAGGEAAA